MSTWLPAASAAAARRVTGSCRDSTLDRVKFRVVCRGNLEIGLESDTQVGLLAIHTFSLLCRKRIARILCVFKKKNPIYIYLYMN